MIYGQAACCSSMTVEFCAYEKSLHCNDRISLMKRSQRRSSSINNSDMIQKVHRRAARCSNDKVWTLGRLASGRWIIKNQRLEFISLSMDCFLLGHVKKSMASPPKICCCFDTNHLNSRSVLSNEFGPHKEVTVPVIFAGRLNCSRTHCHQQSINDDYL